nr:hypothetical protein Q903MT_gene3287 [Picea sitchensis]
MKGKLLMKLINTFLLVLDSYTNTKVPKCPLSPVVLGLKGGCVFPAGFPC